MKEPTVMMPRALTAANGAKALMMVEFSESISVVCEYCIADDDDQLECELCLGMGEHEQKVQISWDTIKDIYAKAVDHFSPTE